jgi:CheY-like chemotaxis protein
VRCNTGPTPCPSTKLVSLIIPPFPSVSYYELQPRKRRGILVQRVIVLDLHLPRYDGMAILRAIRETPDLEHLQVVILTGLANPHQKVEIEKLGAVHRKKPFTLNQLRELAAVYIPERNPFLP